ncbi:hypothetical protein [Streptomyces adustus]|uniref:hypothetical protein n=1 Tax=Streptomyces adustus TaxID=1609272 RepID=UPI0037146AEB
MARSAFDLRFRRRLQDKDPIPEIAIDRHGLATAVNPTIRIGSLAPTQLGPAFEDLFATGGTRVATNLASTNATKEALTSYRGRNTGRYAKFATLQYFATAPAHPTVYVLSLSDGGALAVFPTAHTSEFMLKPQYMTSLQITPSKTEALYDSAKRAIVTDTYQGQALAIMQPSGKPRVLAREYRLVDSK